MSAPLSRDPAASHRFTGLIRATPAGIAGRPAAISVRAVSIAAPNPRRRTVPVSSHPVWNRTNRTAIYPTQPDETLATGTRTARLPRLFPRVAQATRKKPAGPDWGTGGGGVPHSSRAKLRGAPLESGPRWRLDRMPLLLGGRGGAGWGWLAGRVGRAGGRGFGALFHVLFDVFGGALGSRLAGGAGSGGGRSGLGRLGEHQRHGSNRECDCEDCRFHFFSPCGLSRLQFHSAPERLQTR